VEGYLFINTQESRPAFPSLGRRDSARGTGALAADSSTLYDDRRLICHTFGRVSDSVAMVDHRESVNVEAYRLTTWWNTLSNSRRREAYGLGRSSPMPMWMVTSLAQAHVPGLVQITSDPADMLPPWFAMPSPVAELVARRRRSDADA
jgi:hypothetical protein